MERSGEVNKAQVASAAWDGERMSLRGARQASGGETSGWRLHTRQRASGEERWTGGVTEDR
jgi:hypothetical protein